MTDGQKSQEKANATHEEFNCTRNGAGERCIGMTGKQTREENRNRIVN